MNSPPVIAATSSASETNRTSMPLSGFRSGAPVSTKKEWMRLLMRPVQGEAVPSARTARARNPVSSSSSRLQVSAASSPGSTSPAGNSQVKASTAGRYWRTSGISRCGVIARMAM